MSFPDKNKIQTEIESNVFENNDQDLTNPKKNFKNTYSKLSKGLKESLMKQFFEISTIDKKSKCKIKGCSKEFNYCKLYNLSRHLILLHNELFDNFIVQHNKDLEKNNLFTNICKGAKHRNLNINSHSTQIEFEKNLISMLKSGASFSFFECSGFQKLIKGHAERFGITVNRKSVLKILEQHYIMSVDKITQDVKGKHVHLKLDGVSLLNRYFLGVNIQFNNDSKIVVKNIGLEEIAGRTTSEILKQRVKNVLSRYNINLNQIFSIVTDNGANYLKIGRLLNEEIKFDEIYNDPHGFGSEISSDNKCEINIEENIDSNEFSIDLEAPEINIVRCGCHTLQLAIYDSLRYGDVFISEIRSEFSVPRYLEINYKKRN